MAHSLPRLRALIVLLVLAACGDSGGGASDDDSDENSRREPPDVDDYNDEDRLDAGRPSRMDAAADAEMDTGPLGDTPPPFIPDATDGMLDSQVRTPEGGAGPDALVLPSDANVSTLTPRDAQAMGEGGVNAGGPLVLALADEASVISVANDARGGLHVAVVVRTSSGDLLFYGQCTQQCTREEDFRFAAVAVADAFVVPTIAVTSDGRPRIAYAQSQGATPGKYYAECNANCDMSDSWARIRFTSRPPIPSVTPERLPFAVSPGGRALLAHADNAGSVAYYCAGSCGEPSNWSMVTLGDANTVPESVKLPVDSQVQMVVRRTTQAGNSFHWVACVESCELAENWRISEAVWQVRAPEASAEIIVGPDGNPRFAVYGPDPSSLLFVDPFFTYLGCGAMCGMSASWTPVRPSVGANAARHGFNLTLNPQGGSDLTLGNLDGVASLGCSGDCSAARWQTPTVFKTTTLDQLYPLVVPNNCVTSQWTLYSGPSVAYGPSGKPVIAFAANKEAIGRSTEAGVCAVFGHAAFLVIM